MYRTILVPVDVTEPELTEMVVPHVETLAKLEDAQVHFLTVIPPLPYYTTLGLAYSAELPEKEDIIGEAGKKLDDVIARFSIPEDRIEKHVTWGAPKDQILSLAKDIGANVIVIASHKPSVTTYLLGSNAAVVVRHATCPVLVVR
ncbi:universal stress protein UspF [Mangrovibacter yixingensis]|uniref:universal stress protein UspF n=1 Tax=Mangrovibacter yixingensis TaxID=1529639 RepID=UPI001CFA0577|nr:universal stress protein UspF [Mangrovibacter yixingensis]